MKTETKIIEFEVGDKVKIRPHGWNKRVGTIVFVHPIDEVKYIVDFGDHWQGFRMDELKPAVVKPTKSRKAPTGGKPQ